MMRPPRASSGPAIQKELASDEKPVPRFAAEAILSHIDDSRAVSAPSL